MNRNTRKTRRVQSGVDSKLVTEYGCCVAAVNGHGRLSYLGKGSVFNVAAKNELEASLILSKPTTRRGISVTLLTRTQNPSHLVRALYLAPGLAPHPVLSGATAEIIDAEHLGIQTVEPSHFWTEARWREHRNGHGLPVEPIEPPHPTDTKPEAGLK